MSDILNELENTTPVENEETTEEVVENVEEATEDAVADEVLEENEEDTEALEEQITFDGEAPVEVEEAPQAKSKAPIVIIAAVVALIVVAAIVLSQTIFKTNKYENKKYPVVSGMTIEDVAKQMNVDVDKFLEQYGLPKDMPANTSQEAAYYYIPFKTFAEMNGMDTNTLKEQLKIPDETTVAKADSIWEKLARIFNPVKPEKIDENTPWGKVLDEITLDNYVGADNIEEFKKYYELDDSVTGETKYRDVKDAITEKTIELYAEQNKEKEEAEKSDDEKTDEKSDEKVDEKAEEQAEAEAKTEEAAQ